jgi:hypothetical protein
MTTIAPDRKQRAHQRPDPRPQTGLPRQAREGLMRAWLEILRVRHPEVTWIAAEKQDPAATRTGKKRTKHQAATPVEQRAA